MPCGRAAASPAASATSTIATCRAEGRRIASGLTLRLPPPGRPRATPSGLSAERSPSERFMAVGQARPDGREPVAGGGVGGGMAARAIWKGYLEIGELVCPVALHAAASTAERIGFHILNRRTGHRVERRLCRRRDREPVERDDQVKGYETDDGKYGAARAGGDRGGGARKRQAAPGRGFHRLRRDRHALSRPALLPDPGGRDAPRPPLR